MEDRGLGGRLATELGSFRCPACLLSTPQPLSPNKRLICPSSLPVHTLSVAQTPGHSFRVPRPSAQPGACGPHTRTRAHKCVHGQPRTHTCTHTAAELCPGRCNAGVLTHTQHPLTCVHTQTHPCAHARTPHLSQVRAHMDHRCERPHTQAHPQECTHRGPLLRPPLPHTPPARQTLVHVGYREAHA